MSVNVFAIGPLSTNSYLISKEKQAIAIDAGGDPEPMLAFLKDNSLELTAICITHMHFDHLYGVAALADAANAPVFAPAGDEPLCDTESAQGGIWGLPRVRAFNSKPLISGINKIGSMEFEVLDTPGHTPGGVSLYFPCQNCVFTGDALFYRSIGRTDFPYGDHQSLLCSIHEKLFKLPDDVIVYPGHGPSTTIGAEKRENPFCGEFKM